MLCRNRWRHGNGMHNPGMNVHAGASQNVHWLQSYPPAQSSCRCPAAEGGNPAVLCWYVRGDPAPQGLTPLLQCPRSVGQWLQGEHLVQCVPGQSSCWQDSAQAPCHHHHSATSNNAAAEATPFLSMISSSCILFKTNLRVAQRRC